jgi:glutamyl-tRNA reductase
MPVFLLGLSHHTAPVEVRERLAISPAHLPRALQHLRKSCRAPEALILSTCNRTEIYIVGDMAAARRLERFARKFYAAQLPYTQMLLSDILIQQESEAAARHLFRVASGLESLVVGESEILGQVKVALEIAREHGALGPTLNELLRRAISCGKRVREETGISRGAMSIGSAAVELARQIFGPLSGHTVLILGAGKMSALTARSLVSSGAREVIVANRTHERARELASTLRECGAEAEAVMWDELSRRLVEADIVIASTHAPHVLLTAAQVEAAMRSRRHRPLFLIDIAVPRDIDARAHQLDDVFLFDIDDLTNVVQQNLAQRKGEIAAAEHIIESEVTSWQTLRRGAAAQTVASALAHHGQSISETEARNALNKLAHLGPDEQEVIRRMAAAISTKVLHAPLRHLRTSEASTSGDVDALRRAFKLSTQREARNPGDGSSVRQFED